MCDTPPLGTTVLTDEELLEKARGAKNGHSFALLFDEGWTHPAVRRWYSVRRHADLGLVERLMWWARHDTAQVRRLFADSALADHRWGDDAVYRQGLIDTAGYLLDGQGYDPNFFTTGAEEGGDRR